MSRRSSAASVNRGYGVALGAALLVLLAFALNSAFFQSALLDGYQLAEITRYQLAARPTSGAIENLLNDDSRRMTVNEVRQALERQRDAIGANRRRLNERAAEPGIPPPDEALELSISLTSGSVLVSTIDAPELDDLPENLIEQIRRVSAGESLAAQEIVQSDRYYFLPQLLYDKRGRWIGAVVIHFDKQAMRRALSRKLDLHLAITLIAGAISAVGVLLVTLAAPVGTGGYGKRKFVSDFLTLMLVGLGFALLVNTSIFLTRYLEVKRINADQVAVEISAGLTSAAPSATGAAQQPRWRSGPDEFGDLLENFSAVTLTDDRGRSFFRYRNEFEQESELRIALQDLLIGRLATEKLPLSKVAAGSGSNSGWNGAIEVQISRSDVFSKILSLLIGGFTILLITLLVMVEVLLLFLHLLGRRSPVRRAEAPYELGFVRPAMFLFLLGIDLSMAFVPLHMQSFETDLFGLTTDIVAGLPISAEFFCVGLFILIAGVWVDRRGWHEPFFTGLLIVVMGTLWSWAATDALQFILSRAMVGTGYGMTLMSAQGFAISLSSQNQRASSLSSLFAGLYSGSICGAAAGAILAERFGYPAVFLAGALLVVGLIAFAWKFMRSAIERPRPRSADAPEAAAGVELGTLLRFLCNPVFIALSLLSSLPASIAVAGFLHYFTPVYLDQIGARESTIGQVLLLYGICLIFFGPPLGRLMDRSVKKKYFMLAGGLLGGLAFATFDTALGTASVVIAVFLLGVSSSLVLSSQSTMVLELEEAQRLGVGKAIGIFRSISRIGQVVGPIVFGWVLLSADLTAVINGLGVTYIAAMLILAFFVREPAANVDSETVAT